MRDVHRSLSFKESDENIDQPWRLKKETLEKIFIGPIGVHLFLISCISFQISFLNKYRSRREKYFLQDEEINKRNDFRAKIFIPLFRGRGRRLERKDWHVETRKNGG